MKVLTFSRQTPEWFLDEDRTSGRVMRHSGNCSTTSAGEQKRLIKRSLPVPLLEGFLQWHRLNCTYRASVIKKLRNGFRNICVSQTLRDNKALGHAAKTTCGAKQLYVQPIFSTATKGEPIATNLLDSLKSGLDNVALKRSAPVCSSRAFQSSTLRYRQVWDSVAPESSIFLNEWLLFPFFSNKAPLEQKKNYPCLRKFPRIRKQTTIQA